MKAVIMAGGEGVRLRPFTYMLPKSFLPIGENTVLEHTVKNLKKCGFNEIYISINYYSSQFKKSLDYQKKYNIKIHLFKETKKLGTAGSLYLMKKYLREPFCVINGDLIIKISLDEMFEFHISKNADITIGIKIHKVTIPYAVVSKDEDRRLIEMKEKPTFIYYINSGIYILNPSVLDIISYKHYIDMPILIDSIKKLSGRIFSYDIGDYWLDIGQMSDYENALELIERWKE